MPSSPRSPRYFCARLGHGGWAAVVGCGMDDQGRGFTAKDAKKADFEQKQTKVTKGGGNTGGAQSRRAAESGSDAQVILSWQQHPGGGGCGGRCRMGASTALERTGVTVTCGHGGLFARRYSIFKERPDHDGAAEDSGMKSGRGLLVRAGLLPLSLGVAWRGVMRRAACWPQCCIA